MFTEGTLCKILPIESGQSKNGEWRSQLFVVETSDQYPKKIAIKCVGQKMIDELSQFVEGEQLKVDINVESREWESRWFTEVKAWRLTNINTNQHQIKHPQDEKKPLQRTPGEKSGVNISLDDNLPF